ncbi:EscU/YscU/HrcU family type III secretion system export apparatus switch protein [Sphingosinicella soli]|uniref:Flagellar biosynthetic protein FlhB n=1 Tax=Sphingosinicella soli TaxID=333708 RepID=A0A7W7F7L5_9SPHN|nr:flagellar biosynthetic protein FlhB [Sphingosinicella soli]
MADKPEKDQQTEAPTEKRKRDASKKGDVLRSRELTTALVMLVGAGYLALAGGWMVSSLETMLKTGLLGLKHGGTNFQPAAMTWALGKAVAFPLAGLLGACFVAAIASQALLGTFQFNMSLMAPKASRMNPMNYVKRTFGIQGLTELGKSILKVVLVGAIGWWMLSGYARDMAALGAEDVMTAIGHTGHLAIVFMLVLSFGLVLVAGIDIPLQAIQLLRKLRMSRQEIKDEMKQTEGSPEVKMQLRRRQREATRNNMRAGMQQAHVVLTNPTHFAVALRYDKTRDLAPIVVAKGKDLVAEVIRDLAAENEVPVLSYPLLARAVFFTSKIGQEIRDDLYVAVAGVLAFVFSVERDRLSQPDIDVPEGARFDETGRAL